MAYNEQLDLFKEIKRLGIQKNAEKEHKKFVDFMFPLYGLKEHPGYCKVNVRPLLIDGAFNSPRTIHISDSHGSSEEAKYTMWHESSHFLHHLVNPSIFEETGRAEEYTPFTRLAEVAADFGALVYLDSVEKLNPEVFDNYQINSECNWGLEKADILAVMNAAMFDKGLLEKIVKAENFDAAKKVMEPHYKEAEFYNNSICRLGIDFSTRDLERAKIAEKKGISVYELPFPEEDYSQGNI